MAQQLPEIPFNRPALVGRELDYLRQAVEGGHASGDGPFTRRCAELLQRELGVPRVLLTTSCTDALEMCALLLDLAPGDEVVVPSFAFVSTVNAFVLRGARPRFADIRPDTLNLDETRLEESITPRTRAIVALHYAGVGCEMDRLSQIAAAAGAVLIEDNAHGLFARYRGRCLGTFGRWGTQSFHETKNYTCGEGGALLLNDPADRARAEILRDKGTDRQRFHSGLVDKYTWVDIGSSFPLSDLLAAYLLGQLEQRESILGRRRRLWQAYDEALRPAVIRSGGRAPAVPAHCEQPYHMYYLVLASAEERGRFIAHMAARGISCVFHYMPLHRSAMGRRLGGDEADCPVAEQVSERLVRLPFYTELTDADQRRVIDGVLEFFGA